MGDGELGRPEQGGRGGLGVMGAQTEDMGPCK